MIGSTNWLIGETIARLRAQEALSGKHINRVADGLHQSRCEREVIGGYQPSNVVTQSSMFRLDVADLGGNLCQACLTHEGKLLDRCQICRDKGFFQLLQC